MWSRRQLVMPRLVPTGVRFSGRVHRASLLALTSERHGSTQPPRSLSSGSYTVSRRNLRRLLPAHGRQSARIRGASLLYSDPTACVRRPCRERRPSVAIPAAGTVKAGRFPARSLPDPFLAVALAINPGVPRTSAVFLPPLPSSLALHGSRCPISLALEPHIATRYLNIQVQPSLASSQSCFVVWTPAPSADLPPPLTPGPAPCHDLDEEAGNCAFGAGEFSFFGVSPGSGRCSDGVRPQHAPPQPGATPPSYSAVIPLGSSGREGCP